MKKVFLPILMLVFGMGTLSSQTIVSTTAENKKVVLEEFTGIHCGYCPDGHRLANLLEAANPGNVFLINIHTGSYATPGAGEPDFRISEGASYADQSGLTGYPAGTINRRVFSGMQQGSGTAMSRFDFEDAADIVLLEPSFVNVACEATADFSNDTLAVHVEVFYTGTPTTANNSLYVALTQDSILGPQSGMTSNPSYVVNGEYLHMHALRAMISPEWGITITAPDSATFFDTTLYWVIPADINGVMLDPNQLNIVSFIAEGQQEIITGSQCEVSVVLPTTLNDGKLVSISGLPSSVCGAGTASPTITVQNKAGNDITSLEITYDVNGGTQMVHNWTGSLSFFNTTEITLPAISFTALATNAINVVITQVNGGADTDISNNSVIGNVDKSEDVSAVKLEIKTDNYGSETTWYIENSAGTKVYQGGPYSDNNSSVVYEQILTLSNVECYTFVIEDSYGDGLNAGYGVGYYRLYKDNGQTLFANGATFSDSEEVVFYNLEDNTSVNESEFAALNVYPNPSNGYVNLENIENADVQVYTSTGQLVYSQQSVSAYETLNLSNLENGIYLIRIIRNNESMTTSVVINK